MKPCEAGGRQGIAIKRGKVPGIRSSRRRTATYRGSVLAKASPSTQWKGGNPQTLTSEEYRSGLYGADLIGAETCMSVLYHADDGTSDEDVDQIWCHLKSRSSAICVGKRSLPRDNRRDSRKAHMHEK